MSDNQEPLSGDLKSQINDLMGSAPNTDMAKVWLNTSEEPDLGKELSNDPIVTAEREIKPEAEKPPETTGQKVYQTIEEFEADGNDRDYYQGPKAFAQAQEDIKKAKDFRDQRNENRDLLEQIQRTQAQQEQRHQDELTAQRATLEEQVKLADDDDDLLAYKLANNKLQSMPAQVEPPQGQEQRVEPPEYQALRARDERLNHSSPNFDPLYNTSFEQTANRIGREETHRHGRLLNGSEHQAIIDQVERQMNKSKYNEPQQETNPNRLRPSAVSTPSAGAANNDPMSKMTAEHKTLYATWSKGTEYQKQMATRMLEKYK